MNDSHQNMNIEEKIFFEVGEAVNQHGIGVVKESVWNCLSYNAKVNNPILWRWRDLSPFMASNVRDIVYEYEY